MWENFNIMFCKSTSKSKTDYNPDESLIPILKKIIYLQTVFRELFIKYRISMKIKPVP